MPSKGVGYRFDLQPVPAYPKDGPKVAVSRGAVSNR